jgi:outer membrane protein assembly factor BamB
LRAVYSRDQNNQILIDQVRALDLLARKAYFTRRWQLRTGGLLLLGGFGVFVVSLTAGAVLTRRLPAPHSAESGLTWSTAGATRVIFGVLGILILGASGAAALLAGRTRDFASVADETTGWIEFPPEVMQNWPSFRGPGSSGTGYPGTAPVAWDGADGTNILWKSPVPLGGLSSPVVWGDSVFLTGAEAGLQEVYCWDTETGSPRWTAEVGPFPGSPAELPDLSLGAGYAAPSPATDGSRVYAIFAGGDLACLDFDGNLVWGSNVGYVDDPYGHSSSLLIFEELLIVQYDHGESAFVAAFDLQSGSQVWKTAREVYDTWSSPMLVQFDSEWQLVINASPFAAAYDPRTGEELWRIEDILGEVASSPGYSDGKVIIINQLMSILSVDAGSGEIEWELYDDLPDSSSPLAYGGYVIIPTTFGGVTAVDIETGEVLWKEEFSEGFYASPVLVDSRIYLLDREGTMRIFSAEGSYELLGSPSVGEGADATPAFAGGRIFIRGLEHLFCIGVGN